MGFRGATNIKQVATKKRRGEITKLSYSFNKSWQKEALKPVRANSLPRLLRRCWSDYSQWLALFITIGGRI
jgi:hypothetical protein